jgi:hypothetical protein
LQAEAVSAWVHEAVEKEEERRMEFLERMQRILPASLLQLLQERPASGGGHARAPRMEVHLSARSKRLPRVEAQPAAMPPHAILAPFVSPPATASHGLAAASSPAASDSGKASEREAALEEHMNDLK